MEKTTVYFKKMTASKKAVVFTAEPCTAEQVAQSGVTNTVNFKLGGVTVTGRTKFHNFGQQYFVQLDCTKVQPSQMPKVGQPFEIVVTDTPVINQKTGEEMPNLNWGYAG